jgi:large exoprotein involved in heme utilization and adhesion
MRRAAPSFTVEVRRRPRLVTTSNADAQSSETKPSKTAFDRASHNAAATAFGAKKMDCSPADVAASRSTGRILPSLVPDEPRCRLFEDASVSAADSESPSRAPKRQLVQALKRGDQASKSPRDSRFLSDENAPIAERSSTKSRQACSVQSDGRAGATPKDPTRGPGQGDSRGLALSGKGRKRTILARYVFGDENKPGQHWKRRLLTLR